MRGLSPSPSSPGQSWRRVNRAALWMPWLVRAFYIYLAYAFWDSRLKLAHYFQPDTALDPLWPVFWADWIRPDHAALSVGIVLFNATLLAILIPQFRWVRVLFSFAFLEYLALIYSFGKIGHGLHLAFWASVLFIFLPPGWHRPKLLSRQQRWQSVLTLSAVQIAIGLSYTLSGFWKIVGAVWQMLHGDLHVFHPRALELHVAARILQTQEKPPLADWLLANASLLWPLMPLTVLVQLGALIAALRPRLHFAYGAMLVAIHTGISLTMGIHFRHNIFLLVLFFLASPLQFQSSFHDFFKDFNPVGKPSNKGG